MVKNMPFKLYLGEKQEKPSQAKKRTIRGPYRKYTPEEKRDIIQRVSLVLCLDSPRGYPQIDCRIDLDPQEESHQMEA